jgi:hypothetical protein
MWHVSGLPPPVVLPSPSSLKTKAPSRANLRLLGTMTTTGTYEPLRAAHHPVNLCVALDLPSPARVSFRVVRDSGVSVIPAG